MKKLSAADSVRLKQLVEIATKGALEEFLGIPVHQRVLSSYVEHSSLIPSGDSFQIQLRVEIHERPKSNQEPN